jgi:hypothetical protein
VIRTALRLVIASVALAAMDVAHAQPAATEAVVKAAFLYKFAGYVEWPPAAFPAPDAPFVIGVSGSEDVAAELERLVPGRSVNGHPATVKRVREDSMRGVHLLFVGRGDPAARATIRAGQQGGALVVTDMDRGLDLGASINFVPVEDRIGFEVSLDNAEKGALRISARMLAVARRVVPRS